MEKKPKDKVGLGKVMLQIIYMYICMSAFL